MNYPIKAHTRASSALLFNHIFSLLHPDDVKDILIGLTKKGIKNLMDFIGTPTIDLTTLEWINIEGAYYLTRDETRL